ncbi:MAG: DUF58 domain-containing protein [Bacteroidota bacterium]
MNLIKQLYFTNRFFQAIGGVVVLFILAFFFDFLIVLPKLLFFGLVGLVLVDYLRLFRVKKGITGVRVTPEKLSNGDQNELLVKLSNFYTFRVHLDIIDEIPHQFQVRDHHHMLSLATRKNETLSYFLRPVKRGEYSFGALNVYASSNIGLVKRRFRFSEDKIVPVYPSYLQLRQYELLAISNRLVDLGIKKIRKIGHNMEMESIKEYVLGDDYRTINWKATARKGDLMVNVYQDEKSQQVFSLIDKSRVMQMPFEGMSLLDYAINSSLVISNIAIKKEDKAGLITFQHKVNTLLPASNRNMQMQLITQSLYSQKTAYKESDFSKLYATIKRKITQRSLLLLYTNFETLSGMERQLPYLKNLAKSHLLVVIFFQNTELDNLFRKTVEKTKEIYNKAIAEQLAYEKQLIVKALNNQGIQTILTKPQHLTVNTINKYLELKARGYI